MPEWLLVAIGLVIALILLGGVFFVSFRPRKRGARSWLAPRSDGADYESLEGEGEGEGGAEPGTGHGGD